MAKGASQDLRRIADALERLAASGQTPLQASPQTAPGWTDYPAYLWHGHSVHALHGIDAPPLPLIRGVDEQKAALCANVARLARGHAAHDMLLWGARGMGKSALLRAAVSDIQSRQADQPESRIALIQIDHGALGTLTALFAELRGVPRNFLLFLDDLGFAPDDGIGPQHLRSWLEGGVTARPPNVRLAVTSNRRAIVAREAAEQNSPLNPRDAIDDALALSDRFGLSLGFHNCDQATYLAIVQGYAAHYALEWSEAAALEWTQQRGARSGRTAWQYITEIAGRAGKAL